MIDKVVALVCKEINAFLQLKDPKTEVIVLPSGVSNLADQSGPSTKENIICSVVNIEQEANLGSVTRGAFGDSADPSSLSRTQMFSVYLVFYSNFQQERYLEGLSYISSLLAFIESKSSFNLDSEKGVEKINLEVFNLNLSEQAHLFSVMGIQLKPSIVVKTRFLVQSN